MDYGAFIGLGVLVAIYTLLTLEVAHRTVIALLGVAIVFILNILFGYADYGDLLRGIDLDTILLLMSMMIIVSVLSKTGIFEYMASNILRRYIYSPFKLIAVITAFTAFVSAFIDNVTTVLLITPITIEIFRRLKLDPRPALLAVVFASNIGGTATLIGDPPNIIIGSYAKLGFMAFIRNLTPIVIVVFLVSLIIIRKMFARWFKYFHKIVEYHRVSGTIIEVPKVEHSLFRKVSVVLAIVITMFFLEDYFHYPPAVPALIGAGILLIMVRKSISLEEVLADVDWSTLVFFIAMFIVVKGVEELGFIDFLARGIASIGHGYIVLLMVIVWLSAIVSAFVDNIPYVMSMVPVIAKLGQILNVDVVPLYWALSLGGCLGGNGTLVGASANIVVAGIADKHGYHISFKYFLKYGMSITSVSILLSSIYLVLRYALLHL